MKILKILVFAILLMGVFQSHLLPTIYGRIEGLVKDKDTGKGIGKVTVILGTKEFKWNETQTDETGKFVFEKAEQHFLYNLLCSKKGYIPNLPEHIRGRLPDSDYHFALKEGEIKRFEITLEKGGAITGTIYLKDSTGIKPVKPTIYLLKEYEEDDPFKPYFGNDVAICSTGYGYGNTDFNIFGLKPSEKYVLRIRKSGFAYQYIRNIKVRKGETTTFNYTLDTENETGLKGIVTKNNLPLKSVYITLFRKPDIFPYSTNDSDDDGRYLIRMLPPGLYRIEFVCMDERFGKCKKNRIVRVEPNKMKTLNVQF